MAVALHRTSLPLKEHPAIPIGSTQLVAEVPTPGDGQPFSYYRVPGAKSLFIFRPADRAGLQKPSRAAADVDQDDSGRADGERMKRHGPLTVDIELELGLDLDIKASRRADVRLDQRAAQDVIDGKSPLEAVVSVMISVAVPYPDFADRLSLRSNGKITPTSGTSSWTNPSAWSIVRGRYTGAPRYMSDVPLGWFPSVDRGVQMSRHQQEGTPATRSSNGAACSSRMENKPRQTKRNGRRRAESTMSPRC